MKKGLTNKCFVCDHETTENKFGFIGAKICSLACKEIYFKTDNKKIIENKKQTIHGRNKSN